MDIFWIGLALASFAMGVGVGLRLAHAPSAMRRVSSPGVRLGVVALAAVGAALVVADQVFAGSEGGPGSLLRVAAAVLIAILVAAVVWRSPHGSSPTAG